MTAESKEKNNKDKELEYFLLKEIDEYFKEYDELILKTIKRK